MPIMSADAGTPTVSLNLQYLAKSSNAGPKCAYRE